MTRPMPDDDQADLRSVLAHAYEKRQPFLLRLVQAVKDYVSPRTPRKPIIESLQHYRKEPCEIPSYAEISAERSTTLWTRSI
jgi:hypothetical protein